jgi:hypothetical protein
MEKTRFPGFSAGIAAPIFLLSALLLSLSPLAARAQQPQPQQALERMPIPDAETPAPEKAVTAPEKSAPQTAAS